jgi:predicted solute-binding protein
VELSYAEPGVLADRLERGEVDIALIPAIEHLRGVGGGYLAGPAQVARPAGHGILLVSRVPIGEIERVAVHEFSRTSVVATRVVLDRLHGVGPDLLVEKNFDGDWRERHDAILLDGDRALDLVVQGHTAELEVHNIVAMWTQLTGHPLPVLLWSHASEEIEATFAKWLITSRNLGVQNLSRLADGIASTSHYSGTDLYEYFAGSWSYHLGDDESAGLGALEDLALEYDLVRACRLDRVPTA